MRPQSAFSLGFALLVSSVFLSACGLTFAPSVIDVSTPAASPVLTSMTYAERLSPVVMMTERRASHSATLLPNGTVLLAGGFQEDGRGHEPAIASAELYDPTTNTFTKTGNLQEPRSGHEAVSLPDGMVLVVGGWGASERLASAELYDPVTGHFQVTGHMAAPRAGLTATLLPNGTVLIAGGMPNSTTLQGVAEVYDPAKRSFTTTGSLQDARAAHTATLLDDGTVLLIGGSAGNDRILASAERFDPNTGQFTTVGTLHAVRHKHAAIRLPDGNVLVLGGADARDWQGKYSSTEIYDITSGTFREGPALQRERFKLAGAVVVLANNTILVGGGHRQLELFNPLTARFTTSQRLDNDYYFATVTPLNDGRVLVAGGYTPSIEATDHAWVYQ